MVNLHPKTEHLKSHQFPAVAFGYARCKPARLTLPHDLAELWEAMSFEMRCKLVEDALLEQRDEIENQIDLEREEARLQQIESGKNRLAEKAWDKRHGG